MLCRLAVSLRFGHAAEQPIKAHVERIGDIAKAVKGEMNGSNMKIPASVCGKPCSLRDFLGG